MIFLSERRDLLKKHGIAVRMLGDLTLLPVDVQAVLSRVVTETASHDRHVSY